MKTLKDIQKFIQAKVKLYIFVDYENVIKKYFTEEEFNSRDIRILKNFLNAKFIKLYIISNKNYEDKIFKKLQKEVSDLSFMNSDSEDFIKICDDIEKTNLLLYIGNNSKIIKQMKKINDETIVITIDDKDEVIKNKDFNVSKRRFEEILIETNNLYL